MEEAQLQKIQGWFEKLDRKVETIKNDMVTKQQFENRYQALLAAITNLHKKVEGYKNDQDEEIRLIKRAIHDIEEELERLH